MVAMPQMGRSPLVIAFLVAAAIMLTRPWITAAQVDEGMPRPLPRGTDEEDWDFVRSAGLASTDTDVWEKLGDPE